MQGKIINFYIAVFVAPFVVEGSVQISSVGQPVIGQEFRLTCNINPFNSFATWVHDTTLHTTCTSAFCSFYNVGTYNFSFSASGIEVIFTVVSSADNGNWTCTQTPESDVYVFAAQQPQSKIDREGYKDERVIGILKACCCPTAVFVLILLLYKRIAILKLFHVENVADNPCQKRMIYVLLFVYAVILGVHCVVAVIVLPPTIIVYYPYKVSLVIGISFLLIAVCPAIIFTLIYWISSVYVCGPSNARCCTNAINNYDSETPDEFTRKSSNSNAGLRFPVTPGRELPPLTQTGLPLSIRTDLPPLIRTDLLSLIRTEPDKLANTEQKNKTKTKTEVKDQVDDENLPETNKINDS